MTIKDLQAEALRLSGKDRARLAEALLLSLDDAADDPVEVERLWLDEAQNRYRAYREGKTKAKPAEQSLRNARARIR
jgi:putative addiction module component (TIGR02574 family)